MTGLTYQAHPDSRPSAKTVYYPISTPDSGSHKFHQTTSRGKISSFLSTAASHNTPQNFSEILKNVVRE